MFSEDPKVNNQVWILLLSGLLVIFSGMAIVLVRAGSHTAIETTVDILIGLWAIMFLLQAGHVWIYGLHLWSLAGAVHLGAAGLLWKFKKSILTGEKV